MTKEILNRRDFIKVSVAESLVSSTLTGSLAAAGEPGGTDRSNGATLPANAVFRADMSQCQPASALTRNFEKDRWQLLDYETEEGV